MIRRSSRLMEQLKFADLKRGHEDMQKTDASESCPARVRGLFSSPFPPPLASESPFATASPPVELQLNNAGHTLQAGFNDENSPPPKRRLLSPADEHIISDASQSHDALGEAEMSGEMPQTDAAATWFTPIKSQRKPGWWNHRVQQSSEPSPPEDINSQEASRLSSMPSFASWIDEKESDATPSPSAGIDMTDLAVMYDPDTAAKARASMPPPSPVEKLFGRRESS